MSEDERGVKLVRFWLRSQWKHVYPRLSMSVVFKYGLSLAKDREFVRDVEAFILRQQADWKEYHNLTPHQKTLKKGRAVLENLDFAERQMERNWEFNRMPLSYPEFVYFVVISNYLKQQEEKENGEVPEADTQEVGTSEGAIVPIRTDGVRQSVDQDGSKKVR